MMMMIMMRVVAVMIMLKPYDDFGVCDFTASASFITHRMTFLPSFSSFKSKTPAGVWGVGGAIGARAHASAPITTADFDGAGLGEQHVVISEVRSLFVPLMLKTYLNYYYYFISLLHRIVCVLG
jgi:hypothetical protein